MRRQILLFFLILQVAQTLAQKISIDSTQTSSKRHPFVSLQVQNGLVLPTNDFIRNSKEKITFSTVSLKYGFSTTKARWQDYAYGMPYGGVGLMFMQFSNKQEIGSPFAIYSFQRTTILGRSTRTKLNFEWLLGASFNWNPYDPFDNPGNIAIGSKTNLYAGVNIYTKFQLNKEWDVHTGIAISHFSNGATRLPNKGLNLISATAELSYNFSRNSLKNDCFEPKPPLVDKRVDYDFLINISSRQKNFDTLRTNLPSPYIDKKFSIIGVTFAPMFQKNYKYKYGGGLDFLYDEIMGTIAWRQLNPNDGKEYDRVKLGKFGERISLGTSARGELVMPMYSIFANFGYNIIHGNRTDTRFYQIMGIKVYLKENFFGTFGIRASKFCKAQYLYWSLGYTIPGEFFSRKNPSVLRIRRSSNS